MRKRFKRIFSAALAGIVFCTAITFYPVEAKAAETATDIWEGVSSADWMANIDGSTKLSAINIPGTHDSTTKNVDNSLWSKCQDKTIAEQLELGIRYLDIRLDGSDNSGTLYCVHSSSKCYDDNKNRLDLQAVLNDCYTFLTNHPTETIIMRMKEDNGSIGDKALQTYIHNHIKKNPAFWFVTNGRPSLDETRGKIVLARYYCHGSADGVAAGAAGLNFSGWPDQSDSSAGNPPYVLAKPKDNVGIGAASVYVQDWYKLSASNKWKAVQASLDYFKTVSNPDYVYFLNYLSSSGTLTAPSSIASTVNKNFLNYSMEYGAHYGWVVLDFATEELAKHIYRSNQSPRLEAAGEIADVVKALESVIPATVSSDMVLPSTGEEMGGAKDISITWSCNAANILKVDGTKASLVCPSSGDVPAVLTATISKNGCTEQRTFDIVVKSLAAVFTDLRTAINKADAICNDAANAKYNLDALKAAMETANALVQAGADNVTNTQVQAAADALNTLMANGFVLKSTAELRTNMLGWYPLTASSNDVSGNHNNGTAKGVTFDKENGAAFSGGSVLGSYISLPEAMFDRTAENDNLTISFWVKDSRGEKSNVFGFGASKACSSGKHFIVNTNNDNKGQISVSACPNGWGADPAKIQTAAPNANTWFHLTIVMEGKTLTVYKDGVKLDSITEDYSLAQMGQNIFAYIGNAVYAHNPYGGDKDFKGNVKDFRVYGCAVAPEQALAIYNDKDTSGTSTSEEHLLAYYPLTVDGKDASGNHYDAAATGMSFSAENGAVFTGGSSRTSIKDFRIYDYALGEEEANGFMDASIKEELMADLETALDLDITKGEDGSLSLSITDGALTLPTTACGGAAAISWESSNPSVIDNNGKVTLPAASEPIADVTLKATVTLHGKTTEVVFHCAVYTKFNVDTTDLQAVVSSVEAIIAGCKEADYTVSSWQALQQSLAAAKQQLTRPGGEAEVQAASADLQAKKNALAKLGNKASLNDLIKTVKSLKQDEYSTASWEALTKALANAEEIAASNDVSQGDVDAAKTALIAKKNALVQRGDKTSLNQAIADAQKLSQGDYTAESWALFQDALEDIMQTAAEEDVTKEDVDNALALLQDALAVLEKVTCTLTLNPDNGSDIITIIVKKGEKAAKPQKPEKTGFDFEGWFAEGEETAFDFENTLVTADRTLTARWKEAQEGDTPGGDTPGGDNPGGDTPGGDNPGGDNPGDNESQKPISISAASVKLSKITLTYTGKAQKPKATVTYKGKKLAANKDYTVSYSNNIKVGQSSLKVTGKGRYNGSKTVKFTIMPKKNKIVKLTAKKGGKLLVKLSLSTKKSGAKGYEISYSTKKSFKGAKKVKTSKTSYTLKKLKKGKTYYVRVRSYAKIGKKVKYGAYSKAMKKKVTK